MRFPRRYGWVGVVIGTALSSLGSPVAAECRSQPSPTALRTGCPLPLSGLSAGDCSRPDGLEQLGVRTAYTVAPGEVEVDMILGHGASRDGRWTEARGEVTYGVSDAGQVEFGLATRSAAHGGASDREDLLELEGKWRFHDDSPALLALSLGLEVTPHRAGAGRRWAWGTELSLVATRPWPGARLRAHVEVGLALEAFEEIEETWLNVAIERPIHPGWVMAIGGRGRTGGSAGATVVPGLSWRQGGSRGEGGVVVAMGVPMGVVGAAERWGVTFHFEIEF